MENFSDKIKKALLKLFMLDTPKFSKLAISSGLADDISEFARGAHPKEFIALVNGKIKDSTLLLDTLYYQTYNATEQSAHIRAFLPSATRGLGSVHSHPSGSTRPSEADLRFYNKRGAVHLIIAYPYGKENIAAYDFNGNLLQFDIA